MLERLWRKPRKPTAAAASPSPAVIGAAARADESVRMTTTGLEDLPGILRLFGQDGLLMILDEVPHAKALGIEFVYANWNEAELKLPYKPELIGYPTTGVLSGGVITTLLDNASGLAVACSLKDLAIMATLDLRIDYMRPATPGCDIFGYALCHKVTEHVAFVNGVAYHQDRDDPIATSTATFMLNTQAPLKPQDEAALVESVKHGRA